MMQEATERLGRKVVWAATEGLAVRFASLPKRLTL